MPEEQTGQLQPLPLQVGITPDGLTLSFPAHITLPEQAMSQLVKAWLAAHPALWQELVQEWATAKKNELAIIQHIKQSRVS